MVKQVSTSYRKLNSTLVLWTMPNMSFFAGFGWLILQMCLGNPLILQLPLPDARLLCMLGS